MDTPVDNTLPLRETTDAELVEAAERVDNGVRLAWLSEPEVMPISQAPVTEVSLGDPDLEQEVEDLSAALRIVESKLSYLRGAVDEMSLAARVLDVMGMSAAEVRHQVPALRQAIRDEAGR
jgi:hypothetical protein